MGTNDAREQLEVCKAVNLELERENRELKHSLARSAERTKELAQALDVMAYKAGLFEGCVIRLRAVLRDMEEL
jgi:hypothetical protein